MIGEIKVRIVREEDWESIRKTLLEEERSKRKIKSMKNFSKLKNGEMKVAFIDGNLVGCCLKVNGKIKERIILQDCQRFGIDQKLK